MLQVDGATLVAEDDKAEAAFNYFSGILAWPREGLLDFEALGIHMRELSSLGRQFTEEEIWAVIKELPLDNALGPDGFTGRFCRFAWSIIKWDISTPLMLSPIWIAEASNTLMVLYSFSYPRLPTLYP
jgi:hypothetical protein